MIDFLVNLDIYLFHLINYELANPVFNSFMPFVTDAENWLLVYVFLFLWLIIKGGKHGQIAAITLIVGVILTDQINSHLLKEIFQRIRPCHTFENINLLVNCPSGWSFPSSHATNNFVAAGILTYFYPHYKIFYYSIAVIIAFSRVFIGVHYFSDILGGALVGFVISFLLLIPVKKLYKSLN
jgi:undecaprenyl-diphosphatase